MKACGVTVSLAAFLLVAGVAAAQEVVDQTAETPDVDYNPSPSHPFGRPNPDAPPELSQFAFMVGEFDCVDEIRQADGSILRFSAIWNAKYFLNGMGIQDEYWTPTFYTSNIRIFDPAEGKWKVTFFRMPGYFSGVWEGGWEGDRMELRPSGNPNGPPLLFHHITSAGYEWQSGAQNPGWTSSCTRRR